MLCICYSVNGDKATLLTSSIYKHEKSCHSVVKETKQKSRFFSKLSNFYFDLRPPGQDRGAKTRPLGQQKGANPWGSPGGMVRPGID